MVDFYFFMCNNAFHRSSRNTPFKDGAIVNKQAQQQMTQKGRIAFGLPLLGAMCVTLVNFIHRHESRPTSSDSVFYGSDWNSGYSIRGEAPLVANG
jgi:hypothetical protein